MALAIHLALQGQQQCRCTLHLVQCERAGCEQRIWIGLGLPQDAKVVQVEVKPIFKQGTRQRGLAGLPCPRQDHHGQRLQRRLQVTSQPAISKSIHAVI